MPACRVRHRALKRGGEDGEAQIDDAIVLALVLKPRARVPLHRARGRLLQEPLQNAPPSCLPPSHCTLECQRGHLLKAAANIATQDAVVILAEVVDLLSTGGTRCALANICWQWRRRRRRQW